MRKIEDLQADKRVNEIISKIKYQHFKKDLDQLAEYYLQDDEDGDIYFLDMVIALEPRLKQEICRNHITENEMNYFFDFYGSATNDDEEWYKIQKYEWGEVKVYDGHCWYMGIDFLQHELIDTGETVTLVNYKAVEHKDILKKNYARSRT